MSVFLTSAALVIASVTVTAGVGSIAGCLNSVDPQYSRLSIKAGCCVGMMVGAMIGATVAAISIIANAIFWSFSYLTGITIGAGVTAITINPLVLTVSAVAFGLGICACY